MVLKVKEVQTGSMVDPVPLVLQVNEVLEARPVANVTRVRPVDQVKTADLVNKARSESLDHKVRPVLKEKQDEPVLTGKTVKTVLQVPLDSEVTKVPKAPPVKTLLFKFQVFQALGVPLVHQVTTDSVDYLVWRVLMVCLVLKVLLVSQAKMDALVDEVPTADQASTELMVNPAKTVKEELVPLVTLAVTVLLVNLVQKAPLLCLYHQWTLQSDHKVKKALLATEDNQVPQVLKVDKVHEVQSVLPVHRANQVLLVHKATQVLTALMENQAKLGEMALKALEVDQVFKDSMVNQATKGLQVLKVPTEKTVPLANLSQAKMAPMVKTAKMV